MTHQPVGRDQTGRLTGQGGDGLDEGRQASRRRRCGLQEQPGDAAVRIEGDMNRRLRPLERDKIMVRLAANSFNSSILLPQPADRTCDRGRHVLFAHVGGEPVLRDGLAREKPRDGRLLVNK